MGIEERGGMNGGRRMEDGMKERWRGRRKEKREGKEGGKRGREKREMREGKGRQR